MNIQNILRVFIANLSGWDGAILKPMKNQLKIGVVLTYVTMGLNMVIQLSYTPIMIQLLGQSEYGVYTLVNSVVSYLSLFSLGFGSAYMRFLASEERKGDRLSIAKLNGMFLTVFFIMAIIAAVCGALLTTNARVVLGNKISDEELYKATVLMAILVANIVISLISSIFDSILTASESFLFQRTLQLVATVFNPFICLPLLFLGYGSVAIVAVTTFITFGKLICNIYYCIIKLKTQFVFKSFERKVIKELAGFSSYIFINMVIDQINWSVDKLILGWVSGTSAIAIYGVSSQINTLYLNISTAISSVFIPRVNRIVAAGENAIKKLEELFIKVGRIQLMILGLVLSGFIFFGEFFIVHLYAGPDYESSYFVALLLIIPVTIPLIQNIGIEIQRAYNKHKFRAILYLIMAILNILISIPLAKRWGPVGSALGTAISLLLVNIILMNIYYHKAIKINIIAFWKSILSLSKGFILPSIVGSIILTYIHYERIGTFVLLIVLYSITYFYSVFKFGMNFEEKEYLLNIFRKLKRGRT